MRLAQFLLLGLVISVRCDDTVKSPVDGLLQILKQALPTLRSLFDSVSEGVDEVAFSAALSNATELVRTLFPQQPVPVLNETWWGKGEGMERDTCVRPFRVHWSEEMISDLRGRIRQRRNITQALEGAGNTWGTNDVYLSNFLDQWAGEYDFKEREDWLNSFPQYIANIQGLDIHYIHVKPANPQNKKVLPLLLVHGYPVTAFEYVHVIQQLQTGRDDCDFVFEIIAPDLPGYGYSEATSKLGMAPYQMGIVFKNLMERIGKTRFYIQAGDVGHVAGDALAVLFPDMVLGFHTTLPASILPETLAKWVLGQLYPPAVVEAQYENRLYSLVDRLKYYLEYFGYFHSHATKPDNIGHGLDDSPVTLASWLLQLLMMTTDPNDEVLTDGNLPKKFDMRDWMDTMTVAWDARCMTSSVRAYATTAAAIQDPMTFRLLMTSSSVPTAVIRFRHEIIYHPDGFVRDKYPNLVQSITKDDGGHFAGFENPAVLADSIWTAVKKMELFHENQ